MSRPRAYFTTTIPYVNARPHLGFALELVQADVLARHSRLRGDEVRLLTGTDDNSLKNVLAAEAAGVPVREFVDRNAAAFASLRDPLSLSYDAFLRTSGDPRHRAGVEQLWERCAAAGDLYRQEYEGLYCVGCEQFWTEGELDGGLCPEHGSAPRPVREENWFFRLSRYASPLRELITSGRLRIEPAARRNEVLAFVERGLRDFSVSRPQRRARGWGIPVPGDPGQAVYVWWDALARYVSALGYGTDPAEFAAWWAPGIRRTHLVGKGVIRFHAVYWPAILLSAGLAPPSDILVHDYLTVDGQKISKSAGTTVDPLALVSEVGADALRWWLLREVPRTGDVDYTRGRLVSRADRELAGGFGNLVHRVVTVAHRYRAGVVRTEPVASGPAVAALAGARTALPARIDAALAAYDLRAATGALWSLVEEANRYVDATRPWELAAAERRGADPGTLDAVLSQLLTTCRTLGRELRPFLPDAARLIEERTTPRAGVLPESGPLFTRLARTDGDA